MSEKRIWTSLDIEEGKYLGDIEFQDDKSEWHHFEVIYKNNHLIFGGSCNTGFLESGNMECDDSNCIDEDLQDLLEDLKTYYNQGKEFVNKIICNERM